MARLIMTLLPLAIVGLAAPSLISVCVVLLSTRQPIQTALSFVGGAVGVLLVLGTLVLTLFNGRIRIPMPEIGRTLNVLLGVLVLLLALKSFLTTPDPDAPPPRWMGRIESITPIHALLLGGLLVGTNLKIVAAYTFGVNQIILSEIGLLPSLLALLLLLALVLSGPLMPICVYVARPDEAARLLSALKAWVVKMSHNLLTLALVVIGVYFLTRDFLGF